MNLEILEFQIVFKKNESQKMVFVMNVQRSILTGTEEVFIFFTSNSKGEAIINFEEMI